MRVRQTGMRLLRVLGYAFLLSACGQSGPHEGLLSQATPTPTTVVVRDGDSGSTVRLRVRQRLEVRLTDVSWTPPTSSATKVVVRRSSSGGYPSAQPVVAVFEAAARGAADVTSWTDAACFHTAPRCLMPTREWVLHVTVA
jgi:hypothetical protein